MTEAEKRSIELLKNKKRANDKFIDEYNTMESPMSLERAMYDACMKDNKSIEAILTGLRLQGEDV